MKMIFYISSLGNGGAERVICNLANYFSSSNDVMILLERNEIKYEVNNNIKIKIMDDNLKNTNIRRNFITKKIRYFKYLKKMKQIFSDFNPDVIISFLAVPAFLSLIMKPKKSKIIIGVRNDPKTEYTTKLKFFLMKKLYPKADGFVFQTKDAEEYFKDIISCKRKIIYNAVSPSFINSPKVRERKRFIVSVGRLHEQKNYDLLIDSFCEIAEEYKSYNLVIYGDGPEKDRLKGKIENFGLEKRIILAGNTNNIKEKIFDASLFVMSSDFEGMPNSLIEAMVLGLPVISTNCPCGGPKELIVNGENGILVDVGDKDSLISAMKKILDNPSFAEKIGDNARNIVKKVDPKNINKDWEYFINEVVKKG